MNIRVSDYPYLNKGLEPVYIKQEKLDYSMNKTLVAHRFKKGIGKEYELFENGLYQENNSTNHRYDITHELPSSIGTRGVKASAFNICTLKNDEHSGMLDNFIIIEKDLNSEHIYLTKEVKPSRGNTALEIEQRTYQAKTTNTRKSYGVVVLQKYKLIISKITKKINKLQDSLFLF